MTTTLSNSKCLSLSEVRSMIPFSSTTEESKNLDTIPTTKRLREGLSEVIVRKQIDENSQVTLYQNGYVLYQVCRRSTLFPFPQTSSYFYESTVKGESRVVAANFFENQPWYLYLSMLGEDRLNSNMEKRDARLGTFHYANISDLFSKEGKTHADGSATPKHTCKYHMDSSVAGSGLSDQRVHILEDLCEKESSEEIMDMLRSILTEKQFQAFYLNKLMGVTQTAIGQRMGGISQQAVNKLIDKAVVRIKETMKCGKITNE